MQDRDAYLEDEVPLREYVLAVARRWPIVLAIFAVTILGAGAFALSRSDVFEAETKLLIVAPVSERLLGQEQASLGASLSVETLSVLATANDLLQQIISGLDLREQGTGEPWGVERLGDGMEATVEAAGSTSKLVSLPLLTMTVRDPDPARATRIAQKWAEVFVQRNSQLFATEAALSYEFVTGRHDETQQALQTKEDERLAYQQANPLETLRVQRNVTTSRYEAFLAQLQEGQAALADARARLAYYENALAQLRQRWSEKVAFQRANPLNTLQVQLDVTTSGYREFLSQLETSRAALVDAGARRDYYENTLDQLRAKRAEKVAYQKENPLEPLEGEGDVLSGLYIDFLSTLQQRQAALAEVRARVAQLEQALAGEPRLLTLQRSIPGESLFTLLGNSSGNSSVSDVASLRLADEELNPTYLSLRLELEEARTAAATYAAEVQDLLSRTDATRSRSVDVRRRIADITARLAVFDEDLAALGRGGAPDIGVARADVASLAATIADLEQRTTTTGARAQDLQAHVSDIARTLAAFDEDLAVLERGLEDNLVRARADVASLTDRNADLEQRTAEFEANIVTLSDKIAEAETGLGRLDRELGILRANAQTLAESVLKVRIAKEEQAGSIRVVEAAIEPKLPVPANRLQTVLLGGVLGLFLGLGAAFLVYYVQGPASREEPRRRSEAEASQGGPGSSGP